MDEKQLNELKYFADQIIASGYKSICFWMPCFNVSGGAKYFADLAIEIASKTNLKVYYMDYEGGFPSSLLKNQNNITMLKFDPLAEELEIDEPVIIITNSTKVIQMKKMNPKSKMLFWHFETIPCAWHVLFFNEEEKNYMKLAKEKNAMVYHDWSGRDILNEQFNLNFDNKDYLQIYSSKYIGNVSKKEYKQDEINVVWVSRLASDKICSLYNLIDNFAKFKTDKIKRIHIIGDGIRKEALHNYCKNYKDKMEFIFTGTIPHADLPEYLLKNADIVFAMGMSVVESASLKIPSVVVQLDTTPFDDDAFYWLFDAKEYCVGITTGQKARYQVNYKTFQALMNDIKTQDKAEQIGQKCYDYFIEHHSDFRAIVIKFLKYCLRTELTYGDLKDAIKYTPYYLVEQKDYLIKGKTLYKCTKFKNRVSIKCFGVPVKNYLLDEENRVIKWGFFNCSPVFKKIFKKQYVSPDNKSSKDTVKKIGKHVIFIKRKRGRQTSYLLFGKKRILTKRENMGYDFPQSLFKG